MGSQWGEASTRVISISVRTLAAAGGFSINFSDIPMTVNYSRPAWKKQMHGEKFLNRSKPIYAFIHLNIHTCGHRMVPKKSFRSWVLMKFIVDLKSCVYVCVCCSFFLGFCPVPTLSLIWTSVIPAVLWTWYVGHSVNLLLILSFVLIKQFLQSIVIFWIIHFCVMCTHLLQCDEWL